MTVEIKICGLSTLEAIQACGNNGVDLAGFIFFEKSPRHVSTHQAASLSKLASDLCLKTVAVTVDASDAYLDEIVSLVKPDFLQLHGSETPRQVETINTRYNIATIKAFAIQDAKDLTRLEAYEGLVERFLLDAKAPKGSKLPGGNGVSFDWTLLETLKTSTPWMLSGGLDESNIADALAISRACSIDVSSGVEVAPGIKSIAKIEALIKTIGSNLPRHCQ